jgi:hypothetical protein
MAGCNNYDAMYNLVAWLGIASSPKNVLVPSGFSFVKIRSIRSIREPPYSSPDSWPLTPARLMALARRPGGAVRVLPALLDQNGGTKARLSQAAQMDLPALRQGAHAGRFAQTKGPPPMKTRRMPSVAFGILVAAAVAAFAVRALAAPEAESKEKEATVQKLLEIRGELLRLQPLIERLARMEDLLKGLHATSPTLERLDRLQIKAAAVERLDSLLARVEKLEPALAALEAMQRSVDAKPGTAPRQNLIESFENLDKRLAALEKRLYAPPALRDLSAGRVSIEQRLGELEKRQNALTNELEKTGKELQRLRREQRTH